MKKKKNKENVEIKRLKSRVNQFVLVIGLLLIIVIMAFTNNISLVNLREELDGVACWNSVCEISLEETINEIKINAQVYKLKNEVVIISHGVLEIDVLSVGTMSELVELKNYFVLIFDPLIKNNVDSDLDMKNLGYDIVYQHMILKDINGLILYDYDYGNTPKWYEIK